MDESAGMTAKADTLQDEVGRIETNLASSHDLLDRISPGESPIDKSPEPALGSVTDIARRCLHSGVRLNERLEELGLRTGVI